MRSTQNGHYKAVFGFVLRAMKKALAISYADLEID